MKYHHIEIFKVGLNMETTAKTIARDTALDGDMGMTLHVWRARKWWWSNLPAWSNIPPLPLPKTIQIYNPQKIHLFYCIFLKLTHFTVS